MTSSRFSLIFSTNIWCHLQLPVATALAQALGEGRFRLVLTEPVHDERLRLGWQDAVEKPGWVVGPPANEAERERLVRLCLDADIAVMGYGPIEERVKSGKLTLVMGERLLKRGWHRLRMFSPRYANGTRRLRQLANQPNAHALTTGYYAPHDLRTVGAYGDRIWTWGYFVDVNPNPPTNVPDRPLRILWVGRMLDWKRVDLLLRALKHVQDAPWFGDCRIFGDGPQKARLLSLAGRLELDRSRIHFHPPVPFQQVRALMRESDVYVLPSNGQEGWGATSGEAMSEGCVLVANEQAGSARELVTDGETGFLFRDGDVVQLAGLLEQLAGDHSLRMRVRRQAWEQMQTLWHPRVGAERLIALCEGLLGQAPMPVYADGPCRHAAAGR